MKTLPTHKRYFSLALLWSFTTPLHAQSEHNPVPLQWLGKTTPKMETGVSWGVPFKQGQL